MVTDSKEGWGTDVVYCGYADPTRQGTADGRTPSPGTRMGSEALAADLWLSPRALVLGCHRSHLPPDYLSAPVRAQS